MKRLIIECLVTLMFIVVDLVIGHVTFGTWLIFTLFSIDFYRLINYNK